jgi:hypothetical protein
MNATLSLYWVNMMKELFCRSLFVAIALIIFGFAQADDSSVSETTWSGNDIWGKPIALYFAADGSLTYKTQTGIWTNATWKQEGSNIYFEINNRFVEQRGSIHGDEMAGDGITKQGYKGTWSSKRQPSNPDELLRAKSSPRPQPTISGALLRPTELEGSYEGNVSFDSSSLTIRTRCNSNSCEIETITVRGDNKPSGRIDRVTKISPVTDWAGIQRAMQYTRTNRATKPDSIENAALLEKLRPLLDSDAVIDRCIDLNQGGSGAALLCHPSSTPWNKPTLLFLGASLAPCGQGFCGYMIFPLLKN